MQLFQIQLSCWLRSSVFKGDPLYSSPRLTIHSLVPSLYNYNTISLLPKNSSLKWNRAAWYWTLLMRAYGWKSSYLNGIYFIDYQFSHTHTHSHTQKKGFLMFYSPIFAEWGWHGNKSGKCLKKGNSYITSNLSWSLCCLEWNGVNPKIIARCSCLFPRCFIRFLCWKEKNKTVISLL